MPAHGIAPIGIPAKRERNGQPEAEGQRQDAKIDIPNQTAANQHRLLTQGDISFRQQPLADADRAQAIGLQCPNSHPDLPRLPVTPFRPRPIL